MELEQRVRKTVSRFHENIKLAKDVELSAKEKEVLELAKMYASDSESWIAKGDLITAFSGIEYAHGLLDAILKTKGKDPYEDHS